MLQEIGIDEELTQYSIYMLYLNSEKRFI